MTPATSSCTRMGLGPVAATRLWVALKGAELQTVPGCGFPWDAGTDDPDCGNHRRLHPGPGLIADLVAQYLSADRGYDSDTVVAQAEKQRMAAVIPPRRNHKELRDHDRALYKPRHLVENAFRTFEQWRGVPTGYAKHEASFLAIYQIREMVIWTRLF